MERKRLSFKDLIKGKIKIVGMNLLRKHREAFDVINEHMIQLVSEAKAKVVLLMERNDIFLPVVRFGNGSRDFLSGLVGRVFIITDKGLKEVGLLDEIVELLRLGESEIEVFTDVEPEPHIEIVEKCYSIAKKL